MGQSHERNDNNATIEEDEDLQYISKDERKILNELYRKIFASETDLVKLVELFGNLNYSKLFMNGLKCLKINNFE